MHNILMEDQEKIFFFFFPQPCFPNSGYQNQPPEWKAVECNISILFKTNLFPFSATRCQGRKKKKVPKKPKKKMKRQSLFSSCCKVETIF